MAKASAGVDLRNAELALTRARYDLATQVRSNYLGVLVARERIKVNGALAQFADRVYRLQAKRVAAGQAAAYEPLQLRVLAVQAQAQLIQSNHDYEAAWRKLAVTLNSPDMAPTLLAGRIDGPVPLVGYDAAREHIVRTHTDLVTAQNAVARAQYQLRLARITPTCPNIDTNTVIEHDYTTPPYGTVVSLQIGVPLPVFDNNRGNIIAAEAALVRRRKRIRARPETISSPAWPIRFPVTIRTGKRPSSIAAAFSSIRCGPIAAPTSATKSIPMRISTTWSLRSRRWPARSPPTSSFWGTSGRRLPIWRGCCRATTFLRWARRGSASVASRQGRPPQ